MDGPSQDVVSFLSTLQDAIHRLGVIWGHFLRRGTRPGRPFVTLSGRPFTVYQAAITRQFSGSVVVGLPVTGSDAKEYELFVNILWDEWCWTIGTEAWVDADDGGQSLLRQLPERSAVDLGTCLEQVTAAIEDLVCFEDLVPGK